MKMIKRHKRSKKFVLMKRKNAEYLWKFKDGFNFKWFEKILKLDVKITQIRTDKFDFVTDNDYTNFRYSH